MDQQHAAEAASDKGNRARAKRSAPDRRLIRRVANKAQQLAESTPDTLDTLAVVLAAGPTLADLTTAVCSAGKPQLEAANDLLEVLGSPTAEAAVVAASKGRVRLRAMWRITSHLSLTPAAAPESDAKAAIALAHALHDETHSYRARQQLHEALELVG